MKCECGTSAFFYEKICDDKKWHIYKCGLILSETKKKVKCNFLIEKFITDVSCTNIEPVVLEDKTVNKVSAEEYYITELNKYINLCEITKCRPKRFRGNYIANINYILNKLNFPLYFEETESLESLKERVKQKIIPRKKIEKGFPIKLIDYPEYLKPLKIKKEKQGGKKIITKKSKSVHIDSKLPNYEKEEENEINEEKSGGYKIINVDEKMLESDNDSDEESDEVNNTFDVDEYDSVEEYADCDDGGAFSD